MRENLYFLCCENPCERVNVSAGRHGFMKDMMSALVESSNDADLFTLYMKFLRRFAEVYFVKTSTQYVLNGTWVAGEANNVSLDISDGSPQGSWPNAGESFTLTGRLTNIAVRIALKRDGATAVLLLMASQLRGYIYLCPAADEIMMMVREGDVSNQYRFRRVAERETATAG